MKILILLLLWNGIVAEKYTIERRVKKTTRNLNSLPDRFSLPSSVCSGNVLAQCTAMGGTRVSNCTCECNKDKSTFGFYDNQWKCTENVKVHSGCSIRLNNRDISKPILTVPKAVEDSKTYLLPTLYAYWDCDVTEGRSLMCSGTWEQLTDSVMESFFTKNRRRSVLLKYDNDLDDIQGQVIRLKIECYYLSSTYCVILKVQGTTKCPIPPTQSPPTTKAPTTTEPTTIEPTTTEPTTTEPTTTEPTTIEPTTTEPTTTEPTTTEPTSTEPTPTEVPIVPITLAATTVAGTPQPPPVMIITTKLATLTTSRHENLSGTRDAKSITTTSSVFAKKHNKSPSKENNNSGLITGALAGVIGLAILVAIIVVIIRRRKKRKCNAKTKDTVENAGYEKGVDNSLRITERGQQAHDEDEYAYAYTRNAVPFENTNKQDTGDHSYNNQGLEPKSFVANHFYDTTEALQDSPPHLKAPINNTLEEPEYARPTKSKKVHQSSSDAPIHNTLEEPEYAKPNKSRKVHQTCADAPSHNTLEELGYAKPNKSRKVHQTCADAPSHNTFEELGYARPNKSRKVHQTCADAPIYNTLEEPEYGKVNKGGNTKLPENKNEPLYNVLEGPDAEHDEEQSEEPPCYHVLEGPFPDGAPVYDVLEGPEPGEAPVYGSLDGPDPHVYGTLDMCDSEGAFKDNREYNDIVYDSVGEVVNDTGDIYQQLNQSGQGGSDVYQGLSYPDKTMYLKELTESHSNV